MAMCHPSVAQHEALFFSAKCESGEIVFRSGRSLVESYCNIGTCSCPEHVPSKLADVARAKQMCDAAAPACEWRHHMPSTDGEKGPRDEFRGSKGDEGDAEHVTFPDLVLDLTKQPLWHIQPSSILGDALHGIVPMAKHHGEAHYKGLHRVVIEAGSIRTEAARGKVSDGRYKWVAVPSTSYKHGLKVYIAPYDDPTSDDKVIHSQFARGGLEIFAGGQMTIVDGKLIRLNPGTGHYGGMYGGLKWYRDGEADFYTDQPQRMSQVFQCFAAAHATLPGRSLAFSGKYVQISEEALSNKPSQPNTESPLDARCHEMNKMRNGVLTGAAAEAYVEPYIFMSGEGAWAQLYLPL